MKKLLLLLLIIFPVSIVTAKCDSQKHNEYVDYAGYIKMDKSYSNSSGTYTITLYNVVNGLHILFNEKEYYPNSESQIVLYGVRQGNNSIAKVYGDDGCNNVAGTILINTPYFNKFYDSYECEDYKGKVPYCTKQFTSVNVTKDLLDTAISDYNMLINSSNTDEEEDKELSFFDKILEIAKNWGIKLLLVLVSSFGTIAIFNNKFRKLEHGI